jgi:hypothetical protein
VVGKAKLFPMDDRAPHPLAQLPAVHVLADAAGALGDAPRWAVVEASRRAIAARREAIRAGEHRAAAIDPAEVAAAAAALARPALRRVVNATGVVLHTNLGRAPLAEAARAAIDEVAAGYSNLEYDLVAGARGSRHDHLRATLRELTGAEDALVVNNNAAATVLGLAALATDREIVVSRGELVEIGGSFRLPEILALSRGVMVEVGTTNKTHRRDYEAVIGPATALPTAMPACGPPSSLSPENVTRSAPLATASATVGSSGSPHRRWVARSTSAPEPRSIIVATPRARPSATSSSADTSLVNPTMAKFERWTLSSSAVAGPIAAS